MPHPTRRQFLRTLALLAAPPLASARAASVLDIAVERGPWEKASVVDIGAVLTSAATEIWKHCARSRIDGISVYRRGDCPQTDFSRGAGGRIRIGLATEGTRWAQFSFQFGHEFCHALVQHSEEAGRGWHFTKHANLWFEESLCETASLFVLRRMAETWRVQPPYPAWRSYSRALSGYAADRIGLREHQLPAGQSFAAWFRENAAALRANAVIREKNVIVAKQLLPILEAAPDAWEAACFLNHGSRDKNKPFAQHLAEWEKNSPPSLRPCVQRIAEVFAV
jgi:hypothetical protein